MDGQIHIEDRTIFIRFEWWQEAEYEIPANARLRKDIFDGVQVPPGKQLTEGSRNPHRI